MLQVTGLLTKVVTTENKRALKAKAKELTSGDWAAKAVKDAIEEAAAATTAAIAGRGGVGGLLGIARPWSGRWSLWAGLDGLGGRPHGSARFRFKRLAGPADRPRQVRG